MALETARDGITVNCISPGYVWTPLVEQQIPDTMKARGLTREQVMNDVLLAAQPTKRFVTPEEVAALARLPLPRGGAFDHRREPQHGRRLDRRLGSGREARRSPDRAARRSPRLQPVEQPSGMIPRDNSWRDVATCDDRSRLRDWRATFVDAVAAARKSGHSAEIGREGALLEPDAALGGRRSPTALYRCRMIKLGAKARACSIMSSYPAFTCRVARERSCRAPQARRLAAQSGSIFPGDSMRQVLLGTLVLGDETVRFIQRGRNARRRRLRRADRPEPLAPGDAQPHFESRLDVMELVPLSEGAV